MVQPEPNIIVTLRAEMEKEGKKKYDEQA